MPEIITTDDAQYAYDIVKTICTDVGPGSPGTPQERERAEIIKKELESHLGAANVAVEEFSLAPGAFLGAFPMSATLLLIAALLNLSMGRIPGISPWLTAGAALVFAILSPLPHVFEFMLCYELIDPLFPKRQSVNVIGALRQPGAREVKRVLILSGHHDSALENTWIRFLGYAMYIIIPTGFIAYIAMLAMSVIQLAGVITGNAGTVRAGTLGPVLLAYPIVPAIVFMMFFNMGRTGRRDRAGRGGQSLGQRARGGDVQVPRGKPFLYPG